MLDEDIVMIRTLLVRQGADTLKLAYFPEFISWSECVETVMEVNGLTEDDVNMEMLL